MCTASAVDTGSPLAQFGLIADRYHTILEMNGTEKSISVPKRKESNATMVMAVEPMPRHIACIRDKKPFITADRWSEGLI
jgi:hypothetical protein